MTSVATQAAQAVYQAAKQARIALQSGDAEIARTRYLGLVSAYPNNKALLLEAAGALAKLSCVEEAISTLQSGIERMGANALLREGLSNIFVAAERYAEAFDTLWPVTEINPSADLFLQLGQIAEWAMRWEDAARAYRSALEIAPDRATALSLSRILILQEQFDAAENILRDEIARDPSFGPAHESLSRMLIGRGRLMEALAAADAAIAAAPASASAHCARGQTLLRMEQVALAARAFQRAHAADPDNEEARWGAFATKANMKQAAVEAVMAPIWKRAAPPRVLFNHIGPGENLTFGKDLGPEVVRKALGLLKTFRPERDRFKTAVQLRYRTDYELAPLLAAFDIPNVIEVDLSAQVPGLSAFDLIDGGLDLVLAVDIFNWVEDVTPLIAKIADRLSHEGLLLYSIDTGDGQSAARQPDGRFHHPPAMIEEIAARHGLLLRAGRPIATRVTYGKLVPGYMGAVARL